MKTSKKLNTVWQDFKKFISKGNVIDLAIGVIMGSAFGAIVTAVTNILLTLCTWGVPGGITGLVTILKPISQNQIPPDGFAYSLSITEYIDLVAEKGNAISSAYTLYGQTYYYNTLPILNWGYLITAVINFLIIALVLFTILKITNYVRQKRLEAYEKFHPQPIETTPEPNKIVDSPEVSLLKEIRDELKAKKKTDK